MSEIQDDKKINSIEKLIYENLRENYNIIIDKILGTDYYNMSMDVYKFDDKCASDILYKYTSIKDKASLYKHLLIISMIFNIVFILSVFLFL